MPMSNRVGGSTPKFGERRIKRMIGFPKGLDTLHSPFMVKEDVLTVLENGEVDTEGTVRKRRGYRPLYDAPFANCPVRGLYNYIRSDDGISRIVAAACGNLYTDSFGLVRRFDTQRQFHDGTFVYDTVTADEVPGQLRLTTFTVGQTHGGDPIVAARGITTNAALSYRGRSAAFDAQGRLWLFYWDGSQMRVVRSTDSRLEAFVDMGFLTPSGYSVHSVGSIAVDSQGYAHVAWFATRTDGLSIVLYSRYDPNTGTWKSPIYVSPDLVQAGLHQYRPHILVDERPGAPKVLYVIWHGYGDPNNLMSVKISRSLDNGESWSKWSKVGAGTYYDGLYKYSLIYPTVVLSGGVLHVVYQGQVSSDRYYLLHSYSVDQGVTWVDAPPVVRYDGHQPRFPNLSVGPDGNLYLVWSGTDPGSPTRSRIKLREYSTYWHQIVYLSDGTKDADLPFVATNEIGQVFAVWQEQDGSNQYLRLRYFNPNTNKWSDVQTLREGTFPGPSVTNILPQSSFEECTAGTYPKQSSVFSIGGTWSGWFYSFASSSDKIEVRNDGGFHGTQYVRLVGHHSTDSLFNVNSNDLVAQGIDFRNYVGKWFRLSFYWRKTTSNQSNSIAVEIANAVGLSRTVLASVTVPTSKAAGTWYREAATFKVSSTLVKSTEYLVIWGPKPTDNAEMILDFDGFMLEGPFDTDPGTANLPPYEPAETGGSKPVGPSTPVFRPTLPEKASGRQLPIVLLIPEGDTYTILVQRMNPPLYGAWESPPINLSTLQNRAGTVTAEYTIPGGGSIKLLWASSADNVTYSTWSEVLPGSSFTPPSGHNYVKLRVELRRDEPKDDVILDWVQVAFQSQSGMQQLASGLADRNFHFAVFTDVLYIVNGQDTMKYWDPYATDRPTFGDAGGSPPTGDAIVAHKERLFVARGHRLYFSEAFDAEKWPALNFIDIGVGSEGRITALKVLYDALYIFKERAIYVLQGSTPDDFEVKRVSDRVGTLAPRSVVNVDDTTMGFWGPTGYLFFDGVELSALSDPVTQIVEGLVKHLTPALAPNIAAGALDGRVYVSIPDEQSQTNSMTLVFDQDTKSWTVYRGMAGSVFIVAKRGDRYELVWGSPTEGQLYTLSDDFTDGGAAYTMVAETAQTFLDSPERLKRPRSVFILASAPDRDTTLNVYIRTDDGVLHGPVPIQVKAGGELQTARILPSVMGVYMVRSMAVRVEHVEPVEVAFHGVMVEFVPKSVR